MWKRWLQSAGLALAVSLINSPVSLGVRLEFDDANSTSSGAVQASASESPTQYTWGSLWREPLVLDPPVVSGGERGVAGAYFAASSPWDFSGDDKWPYPKWPIWPSASTLYPNPGDLLSLTERYARIGAFGWEVALGGMSLGFESDPASFSSSVTGTFTLCWKLTPSCDTEKLGTPLPISFSLPHDAIDVSDKVLPLVDPLWGPDNINCEITYTLTLTVAETTYPPYELRYAGCPPTLQGGAPDPLAITDVSARIGDTIRLSLNIKATGETRDPEECSWFGACPVVRMALVVGLKKEFMVTFDDGPVPGNTESILSALRDIKVDGEPLVAGFFMVGVGCCEDSDCFCPFWEQWKTKGSVRANHDLVRMVAADKHIIGVHTQHHPCFNCRFWDLFGAWPVEDIKREISDCIKEIREASVDPEAVFRPPYFCNNANVRAAAQALGLKMVLGAGKNRGDAVDFGKSTVEEIKESACTLIQEWQRDEPCVLVFHDVSSVTAFNLAEIIRYLREDKGFALVDFEAGRVSLPTGKDGRTHLLSGIAHCPIDLVITDPDGLVLSKGQNQIPDALCGESDIDGDGDLDDFFFVLDAKPGEYLIRVIPEPNAPPDDRYSLEVSVNDRVILLADNAPIGEIPAEPYSVRVTREADLNSDTRIDLGDFAIFATWWLNADCMVDSLGCGGADLDGTGRVNTEDLVLFAERWLESIEPPSPALRVMKKPVYRFWSSVNSRHFYTVNEEEKRALIRDYSATWTYEGVAYYALADGNEPGSLPVYRFWSPLLSAHFYTISEAEKDMLIRDFPTVWTFEGTAFYAYREGEQPTGTAAVYRFWSATHGCHFYTISETEKDMLIRDFAAIWTFEGIAWYAYPP